MYFDRIGHQLYVVRPFRQPIVQSLAQKMRLLLCGRRMGLSLPNFLGILSPLLIVAFSLVIQEAL